MERDSKTAKDAKRGFEGVPQVIVDKLAAEFSKNRAISPSCGCGKGNFEVVGGQVARWIWWGYGRAKEAGVGAVFGLCIL